MTIKRILLISISSIFISSCTKELKDQERNWNPYKMNEVLVFESSENQLDTIVINKIINNAVSSSPAPELYRHTYLNVYAESIVFKKSEFYNTEILTISSSTPNRLAGIGFGLRLSNANFGSSYKIEELNKYPQMSVTTKAGIFNDVIKLKPEIFYSEREDEVQFMYWSKKYGYIKFERADGFTWELVKKIQPIE